MSWSVTHQAKLHVFERTVRHQQRPSKSIVQAGRLSVLSNISRLRTRGVQPERIHILQAEEVATTIVAVNTGFP